jgi:hypothetical protein
LSTPSSGDFDTAQDELGAPVEGDNPLTGLQPGPLPIDWAVFWKEENDEKTDWAVEPLVPTGRSVALYSVAKAGKSLVAADVCASTATGRSVLGQTPKPPERVLYLDLEMTQADLRERLTDMGYGPESDLSRLDYYQLPLLPALDTQRGGEVLLDLATKQGATLVVIDTMARAVGGDENSADTYRNFYRWTGTRLKAAGIAVLRLDHQGKDSNLGQRGSSAKDDDLDVVFKLTELDGGHLRLTRTRSRIPWVPVEIAIQRLVEPHLHHVLRADPWPAGTADVATVLDNLKVPTDATAEASMRALKSAGHGRRKAIVLAAVKYRRTVR